MRIRSSIQHDELAEFRPLYAVFDECSRIGSGLGQLINKSWLSRSIQSALNTGANCENIHRTAAPAKELAKLIDGVQIDRYRPYASQLSIYDCGNPLIVIYEGDTPPKRLNRESCEILDGKARVVRALGEKMSLPIILISKEAARKWGMPSQLRMLGIQEKSIELPIEEQNRKKAQRNHRQRSGLATLPYGYGAGDAVMSRRVNVGRAASKGFVTNPFAYSLILSSDRGVRKRAHEGLRSRKLTPRGLIDAFPEIKKSGPPPRQYQEKCLLILLAKLLLAGCTLDDLRIPMRHLLRFPVDKKSLKCVWQNAQVDENLERYAKLARAALRKAPSPWNEPLSERLLLFGATRNPLAEEDGGDKEKVLKWHKVKLLEWTFYSLFRTKHWRIGRNLVERFNIRNDYFPEPDDDDPTDETRTVPRIHHEVAGSKRFQRLTDLTVEQLLIVSMHARTNLFLVQHDLHWAVPLGHWAMTIADLDAGRETHVTVWMAELYEEQRRRQFEHENPFTGPATMTLHWLHWVCGDVVDFSKQMAEICDDVIDGFPERSGRLVKLEVDQHGVKTLDSGFLTYQEDWALQATLFA